MGQDGAAPGGSRGSWVDRYWEQARDVLAEALSHEREPVLRAARVLAQCVHDGHSVWAFGCTHSAALVADVFYRAGGLVLINPIFGPGLWVTEHPVTRTTRLEKLPGYAGAILSDLPVARGDALVIVSTSGRNAVPVEAALWARERGVTTVALTSVRYRALAAPSAASRAGRTACPEAAPHLSELADFVIDNHVPLGDAVLSDPALPAAIGPISTFVGSAILQGLVVAVAEELVRMGHVPPVLMSSNVPGGAEHNREVLRRYAGQIHYSNNSR